MMSSKLGPRRFFVLAWALFSALVPVSCSQAQSLESHVAARTKPTSPNSPPLLQLKTHASEFFGLPIQWGTSEAVLLETSGRVRFVSQSDIASHQVLDRAFKPLSTLEASQSLQRELGPTFEVLVQGPYVVAAPKGQAARWRDRFQVLLAGYTRYFEVRGWPLRNPDFPLVAIVQPNRNAFQRFVATENARMPSNVVGSYFPGSNRCVLYQLDSAVGVDWSETEATIVHEAVHQLAFNTGVHERLAENPLWLVEGFATMFEQPAVYDPRVNRSNTESRMLSSKVQQIQPLLREPGALESRLTSLIQSDRMFQQDPLASYGLGWALTFYLSERMPNEFANYLKMQRDRGVRKYTEAARRSDFQKAFQTDPASLAIQMQRLFQH